MGVDVAGADPFTGMVVGVESSAGTIVGREPAHETRSRAAAVMMVMMMAARSGNFIGGNRLRSLGRRWADEES